MKGQILEAIEWFNEEMVEKPVAPANNNIFNVDCESTA